MIGAAGWLKTFSPVTAAKWFSPHPILVTHTVGLKSVRPNSVGGIISGVDDSDSLGPFPRIPYPQTKTSPLSDAQREEKLLFQMVKPLSLDEGKRLRRPRVVICGSTRAADGFILYSRPSKGFSNTRSCGHVTGLTTKLF